MSETISRKTIEMVQWRAHTDGSLINGHGEDVAMALDEDHAREIAKQHNWFVDLVESGLRQERWVAERTIERLQDEITTLTHVNEDGVTDGDAAKMVRDARAEAAAEWAALPKEG